MASTRAHMLTSIDLLLQSFFRLGVNAISPRFFKDDPAQVKALSQKIWPLIENIIGDIPGAFTEEMRAVNAAVVAVSKGELGVLGAEVAADWHALLAEILTAYRADLAANKSIDPAQADAVISAALARASYLGVGSRAVTALFELFIPKSLNFMNWLGPTLAQFSGYEEIAAIARAPQYEHALGHLAEYDAAQTYRSRAPEGTEAEELRTRGLITEAQYRKLIAWSGLMAEFEEAKLNAAYRPISIRSLATAFVDVSLPEPEIRDLMTFTGNRPKDIDLMVDALRQRSISNVRTQYLSALEAAAERGVMTAAELDTGLDTLDFSDEAKGLVHLTVATKKLQQLDELYRKSVSEAYRFGLISDADYIPHLTAIGIADADAQAHYAVDSIAKQGKNAQAALRAEEREAARVQGAAVRAALAAYSAGSVDEVVLAAELAATGLSAALIVYAVAIAQARRAGAQVRVYGQLLPPAAAEVLRRKVAAIGEQTIKKLITPDLALDQLAALNVPGPVREALASKWAAQGPLLILPA